MTRGASSGGGSGEFEVGICGSVKLGRRRSGNGNVKKAHGGSGGDGRERDVNDWRRFHCECGKRCRNEGSVREAWIGHSE